MCVCVCVCVCVRARMRVLRPMNNIYAYSDYYVTVKIIIGEFVFW